MVSKKFVLMTGIVLSASISTHAQESAPAPTNASSPQAQSVAPASSAPANHGLADLDAMTFACPKAGLNAAAREAAKAPSQGTYQFSYFSIIHDAHHAFYEVHFKSNYQGEPELKYCVSMYCQQGWDPKTSKTEVTLMSTERRRGAKAHTTACSVHVAEGKKKRQR
jgi:hypothetical protein